MRRKTVGELLVEHGHVSQQQIEAAIAYQKTSGKQLGEILVELGFLSESRLTDALAEQQNVETWDLVANPPEDEALALVTGDVCVHGLLVPVRKSGKSLIVAMRNPGDLGLV